MDILATFLKAGTMLFLAAAGYVWLASAANQTDATLTFVALVCGLACIGTAILIPVLFPRE